MDSTNGVITVIGRKKLCKAHAGEITLPVITHMAWGDGGVDEAGTPKLATGSEIENHVFVNDEETACRYTATIDKGELTGKEISEMGLFDSDGDLIAYRTFMRKGKDADIPQIYDMDEIF